MSFPRSPTGLSTGLSTRLSTVDHPAPMQPYARDRAAIPPARWVFATCGLEDAQPTPRCPMQPYRSVGQCPTRGVRENTTVVRVTGPPRVTWRASSRRLEVEHSTGQPLGVVGVEHGGSDRAGAARCSAHSWGRRARTAHGRDGRIPLTRRVVGSRVVIEPLSSHPLRRLALEEVSRWLITARSSGPRRLGIRRRVVTERRRDATTAMRSRSRED